MIAKAILIKNYFVSLKEKRPPLRPNSFWGDQRYQRCHSKYVLCVWCMHEQTKTNHRIAWKTSLYMYTNGSTVWFTSSSRKSILFLHGGCLVFMYCTQSAFHSNLFRSFIGYKQYAAITECVCMHTEQHVWCARFASKKWFNSKYILFLIYSLAQCMHLSVQQQQHHHHHDASSMEWMLCEMVMHLK